MTEPASDDAIPRRKFDDIASLFRPVTGTGPSSAFPPHRPAFIPLPPTYTAPVRRPEPETIQTTTETAARETPEQTTGEAVSDIVADAALSPEPSPPAALSPAPVATIRVKPSASAARPRPAEIPWPDAFMPRPNYRKPERSAWTWLLLIPAGIVAAVAITMVDPRSIRSWIDANVLHRTPVVGAIDSPLLPGAFRNPGASVTPPTADAAQQPASPAATPPAATTPAVTVPPTDAPAPPDPVETPALVIPPAGTVPAPVAAAATAPAHINIQFRRNIPGAEGEARRIAALLQSSGGSVELHPNTATTRAATINYYNPADKDAASALATTLANEAASWIVRLGTAKNPPGTIDVWLP